MIPILKLYLKWDIEKLKAVRQKGVRLEPNNPN